MHPTIIKIDSQRFLNNLIAIRKRIGTTVKLCLPVKANAYGHGLLGIARLAEATVDYFGVSCLDEGQTLRDNGILKPILVFGAFSAAQLADLVAHDLEITIPSLAKAQLVQAYCVQHKTRCKVQIKVDTGMCRIGVRVKNIYPLLDFVLASPELELTGVYSHLAASDDPNNPLTLKQIAEFKAVVTYIKARKPGVICHLANSAGVCYFSESYFDMVRPGILSYGYYPQQVVPFILVQPCFALVSQVVYFKVVPAGQGVSYNHRYITTKETRIVTLAIGYGDGYRRGLSNRAQVLIGGVKHALVGTICMDMLMVDIGAHGQAYVGDEAVLIGEQGKEEISITDLAIKLDTIVYEILVGFNERIHRVYI
jgi:alanine racemase